MADKENKSLLGALANTTTSIAGLLPAAGVWLGGSVIGGIGKIIAPDSDLPDKILDLSNKAYDKGSELSFKLGDKVGETVDGLVETANENSYKTSHNTAGTYSSASNTQLTSFYTKIVGVTKNSRQEIIKKMCYSGQRLQLVREKNNACDFNAVMVLCGNTQIGYLSKDIAQKIAPLMDKGQEFECIVQKVTGGGNNFYGVNIKIEKKQTNYYQALKQTQYRNYDDDEDWNDDGHDEEYEEEKWTYKDLCDYYGCEEDDWPCD